MLIILFVEMCFCDVKAQVCRPCVQTNGAVRPIIRKKAALCLLRLLRKAGPDSDMLAPDAWSVKLVSFCHQTYAQHKAAQSPLPASATVLMV